MLFHFIRPYAFYALIPLIPILFMWWRASQSGDQWQKVCDAHLLSHLLVGKGTKSKFSLLVFTIAWLIATIALAGPTWKKEPQPILRKEQAAVILLDVSVSMLAGDIKPSRIERAKFKVLDLLKNTNEGQVALIAYTDEPFVVSPLTQDAKTVASLVPVITPEIMPVFGSDLNKALKMAGDLLTQAGLQNGSIIVVTDSKPKSASFSTVKKLKTEGFDTSVLAVGTEQGGPIPLSQGGFLKNKKGDIRISKLEPKALKDLAKAGGGVFTTLTANNQDVNKLVKQVSRQDQRFLDEEESEMKSDLWQDNGHWFLLLILPVILFGFRRAR